MLHNPELVSKLKRATHMLHCSRPDVALILIKEVTEALEERVVKTQQGRR